MPHDELTVTSVQAARALRDTPYLNLFLDPVSPSDVGRTLGVPANLVHHHARRLQALGLLVETGRQGGRVLYQLAAPTIRYDRRLLDSGEAEGQTLHQVSQAFLRAFDRSDHLARGQDPEYAVFTFHSGVPHPGPPRGSQAAEAHPAHLQVRTLRLTAQQYQDLVRTLSRLLAEQAGDDPDRGTPCTFEFLAFDGSVSEAPDAVESDVQLISSFVPLHGGPRG